MSDEAVRDIKRALVDPMSVCDKLGLLSGRGSFTRQAGGLLIRCPVHDDRTPSCSVQVRSGALLWKCHACDTAGDVLTLVAAMHGLTMTGDDFRQVLIIGAELAGLHGLAEELGAREQKSRPRLVARPEPIVADQERDYPVASELESLWRSCGALGPAEAAWANARGFDADLVGEVAKAIPASGRLPRWASYQGKSWRDTGHRLLVPVYDSAGWMRSVRAIRVTDGESPKRLPPAGHKASGLVMACDMALSMLRGSLVPERVLVVEGEPDFIVAATVRFVQVCAKLGIVSGSWTPDLAAKIPKTAKVYIGTHNDPAGDKYAKAIIDSLPGRTLLRWPLTSEAA